MFSMREIFLCASLGCGVGGDLAEIPGLLETTNCSLLRASYLATQKKLPIGIILSFVLLTSMKLPSLLTFVHLCFVFYALHCYNFGGHASQCTNRTL